MHHESTGVASLKAGSRSPPLHHGEDQRQTTNSNTTVRTPNANRRIPAVRSPMGNGSSGVTAGGAADIKRARDHLSPIPVDNPVHNWF